jgi:hypothetical protein
MYRWLSRLGDLPPLGNACCAPVFEQDGRTYTYIGITGCNSQNGPWPNKLQIKLKYQGIAVIGQVGRIRRKGIIERKVRLPPTSGANRMVNNTLRRKTTGTAVDML